MFVACNSKHEQHLSVRVFQTSASGDKLTEKSLSESQKTPEHTIQINPNKKFQVITGIGGAFTESSASILNQLSKVNRDKIMNAYFSVSGANYSLTRTHINSCDFSLGTYSYDSVVNDTQLQYFDISPDKDDLIPMIKEAQAISKEGFKIIASPWTAPPWMKDNNKWKGGKLLPKYYPTWANYLVKYIHEYKKEGIPIWALTIENEPLGNGGNWESMHYTPQEMASFIKSHLGPQVLLIIFLSLCSKRTHMRHKNILFKQRAVLMQKFLSGKTMLGTGKKKRLIGVGIGQLKKINQITQNIFLHTGMPAI